MSSIKKRVAAREAGINSKFPGAIAREHSGIGNAAKIETTKVSIFLEVLNHRLTERW